MARKPDRAARGRTGRRPDSAGLTVLAVLLPCVLAVSVHIWGVNNVFVLDDRAQVIDNLEMANFSILRHFFAQSYYDRAMEIGYRPFLTLSYAVERALWGPLAREPWGYHLTNLALHLGNVMLVFFLARLIFARAGPSMIAASVFAIHPVNTEVVNVLTFRDDSLGLLLMLGGLLLFVQGERTGRRAARAAIASAMFLLAAFTKEQAAVFPLVLLWWWVVFERGRGRGGPLARRLLAYVPYAAALILFLSFRLHVSGMEEQTAGRAQLAMLARIVVAPRVLLHYLRMLVFPAHQSYYYPAMQWQHEPLAWANLLGILIIGYLIVLTTMGIRRWPVIAFCGGWFFIMALPVANIAAINNFAAYDRYLYAMCVAFGIAAAHGLMQLHGSALARRQVLQAALWLTVTLWGAVLAVRTVDRVLLWKDGLSIWANALLVAPRESYVHNGYGAALNYFERFDESKRQFQKAIALADKWPDGTPMAGDSYQNLGLIYSHEGQYDKAIEVLEKAAGLLKASRQGLLARRGLAEAYQRRGDWREAISWYQKVLQFWPNDPELLNNVADLYVQHYREAQVDLQDAVNLATRACQLSGWQRWQLVLTLADAHFAAGRRDLALQYGEQALALVRQEVQRAKDKLELARRREDETSVLTALEKYRTGATGR